MSDNNKISMNPLYWNDFLNNDSDQTDWSFQITKEDVKKYCEHKWVEMGFMHSKIVCKHCDIEKTVWEKWLAEKKQQEEWDKHGYIVF